MSSFFSVIFVGFHDSILEEVEIFICDSTGKVLEILVYPNLYKIILTFLNLVLFARKFGLMGTYKSMGMPFGDGRVISAAFLLISGTHFLDDPFFF